ncbi:unnamed protein product [Dracunculus medinensis]|uniref:Secreted protein n=1 Tax=Dracunculus medinensis TaxID=318479 RepID=A0A0N4UH68_DRAME|nr:unnamed protein product [Dracunculus medinensis]
MKTAVAEIVIIAFHIITLCIHESFGDGGGLAELAAITGDVPYFDSGNPWITYPRIADGGGRFYKPYYYDRVSPYYTSDLSLPYYYSLRGFSRRSPERLGSRTIFYGGKRDSLINT